MRDGCVNCEHTEENSTSLRLSGMVVYAIAAGWPMTYTINMAGVGMPVTGANTTIACSAYAEVATRMDMKRNLSQERSDRDGTNT